MEKGSPIRVLLVDDNTSISEEVQKFLQTYPNIEFVGRAHDGEEAVLKAGQLQPTVVLMDIDLPKLDGITATRLIKANYPHIAVVGLTVQGFGYNLDAMQKAGALETMSKENIVDGLYPAIQRAVAATHPILVLEDAAPTSVGTHAEAEASTTPTEVLPMSETADGTTSQTGS